MIISLLLRKPEKPTNDRLSASDRAALAGIILVLRTDMQWKHVSRALLEYSSKTNSRRRDTWQAADVWTALHRVLLERVHDAAAFDWSRAALDRASLPAKPEAKRSTIHRARSRWWQKWRDHRPEIVGYKG